MGYRGAAVRGGDKPDIGPMLEKYEVIYRDRDGWQPIRCPSPTHEDASASASLNLANQVWKCHACAAGGDVYSLVREVEGVDFPTARRTAEAAVRAGGGSLPDGTGAGYSRRAVPVGSGYRPRYRRTTPARLQRGHGAHPGA